MTDKVPPKTKTAKKAAAAKKPAPKAAIASMGHNSGEKHPEVIKKILELMAFATQKKSIAKAERDVRNSLKTEFGILSSSVAREIALRKLDPDVRVQVETNHEDLKKMLGYQPQLDFVAGVATQASVKAQPSEDDLKAKESFKVEGDDNGPEEQELSDEAPEEEETPPVPDNLKRPGVITREG